MRRILALLALVVATTLPAAGQGIATITGNSISITISRLGVSVDLTLSFEDVTALNLANLGLSAQLINPLDPSLRARLPQGATIALPLLLRIEPPVSGGLSFRGVTAIDIHTENLVYVPGTPLRFFTAPVGGAFEDFTSAMGAGSYRARGSTGGFSEFLIVADLRPVNQVITTKFDRLEDELNEYASSMPSALYQDLAARLAAARSDFTNGQTLSAIQKVDGFISVVQQHSGTDIPNVWRSARDVDNVAGYLRGGAMTLRFSLVLKSESGH
jgi:hypothetical protein